METADIHTHYVLGLLFDYDLEHVLLQEGTGRNPVVGRRWNGIGGKVEKDEHNWKAMKREADEELFHSLPQPFWDCTANLVYPEATVHVFGATVEPGLLSDLAERSLTEEQECRCVTLAGIRDLLVMDNIPMLAEITRERLRHRMRAGLRQAPVNLYFRFEQPFQEI